MPELPEVEVVRRGLAPAVDGARVAAVSVEDARALKRHEPLGGVGRTADRLGSVSPDRVADFERRMTGAQLSAPARRGKFLWIPIVPSSSPPSTALLAHLGMSGQMLLRSHDAPEDRHVRVRLWIEHPEHGEMRLDFADQRLFGSLAVDALLPTPDGFAAGSGSELPLLPGQAAHIARDPLDPAFDDAAFVRGLRAKHTAVKRALLNQQLMSGVGNIYADESLWRARLHPETPASNVSARKAGELLTHVRSVFDQALLEGGTSFDEQYVNVNGQAGYFAHSLNAYGRDGQPCPRCGGQIRREAFMNRSSHFCPKCQRRR